ncbi:MAG: hypothetical protein JNK05_00340 [Myxococcales bacterium]|nr:hypothetical protein [Myxococcales bacterium]
MGSATPIPIPNRMTRATNPAGVRVYDGELSPRSHGNLGAYAARTLAFDDAEGGWEFRRRGYAQVQQMNSAGAVLGETNPCSTVGTPNSIAVIDRRARKLDSGGNPISCTVDSDCGPTGSEFLCTQRPYPGGSTRYCARFICQATTTPDSPDEPSQLSETCGCNTSSLLWANVPLSGPNQVRRIQRRTSSTGVRTSYQHDDQGRIIAQCVGDDNDVVVRGDASSCPSTGQLEEWSYDSEIPSYMGITPWAVHEYRRTSVRGSGFTPYSRVWTRSLTTGHVTSDVETAWTYSQSTWTWALQTRTTTYSFTGSPHDGWTQRVGPGDGSASDPIRTAEYWPLSTTNATSGQVRYSRWRRERPGGAALEFQREYSAHTIYGVPATELDEHANTTTTTFDSAGRTKSITTPLGTTYIAYDSLGRMLSMRRPSGQATVYEYNGNFERPFRIVTSDTPTLIGTDAVAASDGAVIEDTVDPYAVHITRLFRARAMGLNGAEWMRTTQHLDDHGRVARDENAATGGFTTRTYDNFGELLESQDTAGVRTRYTRDTLGRVTTLTRDYLGGMQASTTFVYQGTSVRAAQTTQPNGHTLYYTYDDWGQLVYSYAQDMGSTWSIYAPQGYKTTQYEANGTRTAWTYDRAGRVITIDYNADYPSLNGGDRRFWYDALPAGVSCPSVATCANLLGRLAYVENDATLPSVYQTFYGYSSAGLVQHEDYLVGGVWMRTQYEYDTIGRRTRTVFPFWTGDSIRYTYNDGTISHDAEQVSAAHWDKSGVAHRPVVERIERMPNGPISRMWYAQRASGGLPTNASIERNWRLDGTPSSVRWRSGLNTSADVADWSYSYHSSGQIAGLANASTPSETVNYQYDTLGQLTCATEGPVSSTCFAGATQAIATYSVDTSGTRTQAWDRFTNDLRTNLLGTQAIGPNRPGGWTRTAWSGQPELKWTWGYGWSNASPGQRIQESRSGYTRTTSYWPSGEVAAVQVNDTRGTTTIASSNDHRGRRMFTRTTYPGGLSIDRFFIYDDSDRLIGVHHTDYSTNRNELFFNVENETAFRLVIDNGWNEVERTYFYNDHLGTPRTAVSSAANGASLGVTYRAPREPFMASAPVVQNAVPVRLRFPGQWEDDASEFVGTSNEQWSTNLLGNHARVMEPTAGAYGSVEPVWYRPPHFIGAFAPIPFSTYAMADPVGLFDQYGDLPSGFGPNRTSDGWNPRARDSSDGCGTQREPVQTEALPMSGAPAGPPRPSEGKYCPHAGSGACDGRNMRCSYGCDDGTKCELTVRCSERGSTDGCPSQAWCF